MAGAGAPRIAAPTSIRNAAAHQREVYLTLFADQRGATAIEYGLIAALIAIACIMAFQMLGLNLANIFTTATDAMRG
jgi:pilus assembly protein Flp/PilA